MRFQGFAHARTPRVLHFSAFICMLVSHRCVSLLVRVRALDAWGELVPSKIFNPPFPVLKAGHSVSYSCVCDVCREWVIGGGFLSVWLVCYAHFCHAYAFQYNSSKFDFFYNAAFPCYNESKDCTGPEFMSVYSGRECCARTSGHSFDNGMNCHPCVGM